MASRIHEIGHVCRFCLCKDGLISLSEAIKSAITLEDIERCTGVKISVDNKLPYAICGKCHKTIETFVLYRGTCLSNDTIFKKLVILLSKFEGGKSQSESPETSNVAESTEIDNQSWTELEDDDPGVCSAEESEAFNYTDFDVEILHDSVGEIITSPSSETLETSAGNRKDGVDREGSAPRTEDTVITLDDEDSNDYKPSADGEVMDAEVNEAVTENADSDSDDSIISLYSEVMRGVKKKEYASLPLESTLNVNHDDRELCPYCGVMIRFLDTHIKRTHIKEKRFSCPYCPMKLTEKSYLKEHINSAHEKRIILTCEHCGRGFTNSNSHYYHVVNSHGKRDIYECDICHRKFKSHDGHKKHLKEHSLTALPCSYCDKLFKTMATLERHTHRYHSS